MGLRKFNREKGLLFLRLSANEKRSAISGLKRIIWSLIGSKAVYVFSQFKILLATKKGSGVSCRAIEAKDSDPRQELLFEFDDCLYELQRKRTCLTTPILWALFFTLDFTRGKFSDPKNLEFKDEQFLLHGCRNFL